MSQMIEFGVITALIGAVLGVLSFYLGRVSLAKKEGEGAGAIKKDIEHIKKSTDGMESGLDDMRKRQREMEIREEQRHLEVVTRLTSVEELSKSAKNDVEKHDESIRRLHTRIDGQDKRFDEKINEHERKYHSA